MLIVNYLYRLYIFQINVEENKTYIMKYTFLCKYHGFCIRLKKKMSIITITLLFIFNHFVTSENGELPSLNVTNITLLQR